MASADNAAKARLGKLKKKADELGIPYQADATEETLKRAIGEAREATAPQDAKKDPAQPAASISEETLLKMVQMMGKAIADGNRDLKLAEKDNSEETYAEPGPDEIGEPKTYYTNSIWWMLPAKRIANRLVMPPYGKILFKREKGSAVQVGTQWQVQYTSTYTTDNLKIQAYMDTHPLFRRVFFQYGDDVSPTSDQVKYATAFGRHFNALSNTYAKDLSRRLTEVGVTVARNWSLSTQRTKLAEKLAEMEVEASKAQLASILQGDGRKGLISSEQPTA